MDVIAIVQQVAQPVGCGQIGASDPGDRYQDVIGFHRRTDDKYQR